MNLFYFLQATGCGKVPLNSFYGTHANKKMMFLRDNKISSNLPRKARCYFSTVVIFESNRQSVGQKLNYNWNHWFYKLLKWQWIWCSFVYNTTSSLVLWGADKNSLHFAQTRHSCVLLGLKKFLTLALDYIMARLIVFDKLRI